MITELKSAKALEIELAIGLLVRGRERATVCEAELFEVGQVSMSLVDTQVVLHADSSVNSLLIVN